MPIHWKRKVTLKFDYSDTVVLYKNLQPVLLKYSKQSNLDNLFSIFFN